MLWSKKLNLDGVLAIHDVFPDPNDGGRPPYNIYLKALESGNFEEVEAINHIIHCIILKCATSTIDMLWLHRNNNTFTHYYRTNQHVPSCC